jgi:hypothetical protein
MSALGQKRTCAVQYVMSALHPKADMCGAKSDARIVPIADIRKRTFPIKKGRPAAAPKIPRHGSVASHARLLCVIPAVEGLVMLRRRPVFGVPIRIIPVADSSGQGRSRGCQAPNPHQPLR